MTGLQLFHISEPWYFPEIIAAHQTGKQDPGSGPLTPNLPFTIGYGDPGNTPWSFPLPGNVKFEVGFFKIYLTNVPMNIAHITVNSPFSSPLTPSKLQNNLAHRGPQKVVPIPVLDSWATEIIPFIHVRKGVSLKKLDITLRGPSRSEGGHRHQQTRSQLQREKPKDGPGIMERITETLFKAIMSLT